MDLMPLMSQLLLIQREALLSMSMAEQHDVSASWLYYDHTVQYSAVQHAVDRQAGRERKEAV